MKNLAGIQHLVTVSFLFSFQFGNDSFNNKNQTNTRFIRVDTLNPLIQFVAPSETSGQFLARNNILVNVTATDTNLKNITITLYNSTGLYNSTTKTTSPHYLNISNVADGIYFFNATAYDTFGRSNSTATRNVNIDTTRPKVFDVRPVQSSTYNETQTIEVAANVTETNLNAVLANVTYPNGTRTVLTLSLATGAKYNVSFTIPTLPGVYNITFIANDSAGWINNTVITNFTALDIKAPTVNITAPLVGSNYGAGTSVIITANVTDQTTVDTVLVNITLPNASIVQQTMSYNVTSKIANSTFTQTSTTGTYTIRIIANDTRNNINSTQTRTFNIQDISAPLVNLVSPADTNILANRNLTFICNATEDTGLINITLYHNISGSFISNKTNLVTGTANQTNFTVNNTADGTYKWNCLAHDGTNTAFAINNYSVSVDTTAPSVTAVRPLNTTTLVLGNSISINATAIDAFTLSSVLANVTLPNGTSQLLTLLDTNSDNIFNFTYTPSITGQYNITIIANDSVNNINNTQTTFFKATLVPNVTLNYPSNAASLTNSLVEFNFTATDDDLNLTNCSLYTNITGSWVIDTTLFNVSNGTLTNITKFVPDGTFGWNVQCFDSLGYSNFSAANYTVSVTTNVTGLFAYQQLDTQTPLYRIWNEYNISGNEIAAPSVAGDMTWATLKGNHQRKEFILGTEDKNNNVKFQIYDVTTKSWNNLSSNSDGSNAALRAFDIAYEEVSGDALIVYENSAASNSVFAYRTWNGTDYSAEQTFTTDLTAGVISWVALTPDKRSDSIMALIHNNVGDLYAVPWNGTGFVGAKNSTLSSATISSTEQHFAFAWEEIDTDGTSQEGLVVYGESTNLVYRTYNSTTSPYWGTENTIALADSLDAIRMCSDKDSDYVGLIYQTDLTAVNVRMWNGTELLSSPPSTDSTTEPNGANNANIDCVWLNSTSALFGFVDTDSLAMDYVTFTKSNTWSTADLTTTITTSNFGSDDIAGLRFSKHPTTQEVMITAMDIAEDITAIWWDNSAFQTISASPFETSTEVLNGDQEGVMFDWYRFDSVPAVTNLNINDSTINSGEYIKVNVTVSDDISVASMIANITAAGSVVQTVTLTDADADGIYNGTITVTTTVGTNTVTIFAQDNSTHQNINNSVTTTFTVLDVNNPIMFNLVPITNTNYNVSESIQIAANVTDNAGLDTVLANVTYPNGTVEPVTLSNGTGYASKYNISFTIPALIGQYNITFIANDTTNNINNTETTYFIGQDNLAQSITLNYPINGFNTSLTTFNFNWTAIDNYYTSVDCNVTIDGTVNASSIASVSGSATNYSISGFNDGVHTWNVTCIDNSTNTNTSETRTFTVDTTNPAIAFASPTTIAGNQSQSYVEANITFSDTTLGTFVIYLYNSDGSINQSNTSTTSPYFINYTGLADGTYYLNATINDTAGNINSTLTRTITLDTTYPIISLATPYTQTGNYSQNYIEANISVIDTNLKNITINIYNSDGSLNQSNTSTTSPFYWNYTGLSDGTYYLNATTYDGAGNVNSTATQTIVLDTTFPQIVFATPYTQTGNYSQSHIEANISVTDTNLKNITINIYNSDGSINQSNTSTSSPYFINYTGLADGTYYLNSTTYDFAGNVNSTATQTIVIDITSTTIGSITSTPTAPVYNNGSIQNVSVNFTSSEYPVNITFYLYNSTGSIINTSGPTTLSSASDLPINFTIDPTLTDGNYSLNFTIIDSSGNNATNTIGTVVVDSTIPTAETNSPTINSGNYSATNIYVNISTVEINLDNITINIYNSDGSLNLSNSSTTSPFYWNYTGLSDGTYYWNSTIYDLAGNLNSTSTQTIVIDTTYPTISFATPYTVTGNYTLSYIEANISVTDTNLKNITINVYNSDGSLNQSNTSTTSPFYWNYTNLADGIYYLNATTYDNAGNVNSTATQTIVLDTIIPIVSLFSPPNNTLEIVSGLVTFVYNVTDTTSQINNCSIYLNDILTETDNSITKDSYQTFTRTLSNGQYNWTIGCYDYVSNTANSSIYNLSIDVSAPTTKLNSPVDSYNSSSTSLTFNCSAIDDSSLVNMTLNIWNSSGSLNYFNTTNLTGADNSTTWTTTLQENQNYSWNCLTYDDSSLSGWGDTNLTVFIDTLYPTISYENPVETSGDYLNRNYVQVNVSASDSRLANITIFLYNSSEDLQQSSTSTSTPYFVNFTSITDGVYYFNSSASDSAGNTNSTATRNVTLDTTYPLVDFVSPSTTTGTYSQTYIEVNISVTDTNFANVTFYLYNSDGSLNQSNLSTTNPYFINYTLLSDGTYYVNATAYDIVANSNSSSTQTIVINTGAPVASSITSTPGMPYYNNGSSTNISINFTSSAYPVNITFYLYNSTGGISNSSGITTLSSASNLPINFSFPGNLGDGNYSLNFTLTDTVGNNGTSNVGTIVIDTSFPSPTSITSTPTAPLYNNGTAQNVSVNFTSSEYPVNLTFYLYNSTGSAVNTSGPTTLTSVNDLPINYTIPGTLGDGNYSLNFTLVDLAGNSNGSNVGTIVIDATSPVASSITSTPTTPVFNNGSAQNVSVNFTSSEYPVNLTFYLYNSSGSTVNTSGTTTLNSISDLPINFTIPTTLSDGNYSLNFTLADLAGNSNESTVGTIVIDSTTPAVFGIIPTVNTQFALLAEIEVAVNVTDTNSISVVLANITLSNGSIQILTLTNVLGNKYNVSFNATNNLGEYNITFIVNDSSNNINNTQVTNFSIVDSTAPVVTVLGCTPSSINLGQSTQCIATVSDNVGNSVVTGNVTLPNGTILIQNASNISDNYFFTFNNSVLVGQYSVLWFANDTSGNSNTGTNNFNVSDITSPVITLNIPINGYNSSSSTVVFNITATDDALTNMNCSVTINGTINQTNSSTLNGSNTLFSITGFNQGDYMWNTTCTDNSSNTNTSTTRTFTVDTSTPNFFSLTTSPNTEADLDPNTNITLLANITDNITSVNTVILQYKINNASLYTNLTGTLNSTSGLYYGIFNATSSSIYNLRIWVNDSAGNNAYSNSINISVAYDRNWTRTPSTFTPLSATFGDNVTLGNLMINNTGDFVFNFTIVSDSNATLYNTTENFTLQPNEVKVLQVNDTASETGIKTIFLNISVNDTAAVPTSLISTGTIVVAPGQPILIATFTTPSTETLTQTQGDTNLEFIANLQNIGEGNATNVTFLLDIPDDWTVTFGSLNNSFSTLNSGVNETLSIEVTIPSSASTGLKDVIANATGFNASGTDLHTISTGSLIFADSVAVTVNALPSVLGIEATAIVPAGSSAAPSTGAGGSGGGGGGISSINTVEIIEVVRGTKDSFPISVKNIYLDTTFTNVKLELTGFLAQYISWTPEQLNDIAYLESKDFTVWITVPSYVPESEYELSVKITGDLIANDPKNPSRTITETRDLILKVLDISKNELLDELTNSGQCLLDMQNAGFPTLKTAQILNNARNEIDESNTALAKTLLDEVCQKRDDAFKSDEIIQELEEKIKETQEKNILSPKAVEELELAKIAFEREDFSLALTRARDTQLTFVLETKGKINIIQFMREHTFRIGFVIFVLFFLLFCLWSRMRILIIKNRIKNLNKEELNILDLIREAQNEYLKKKVLSLRQFNNRVENHRKRIIVIKKIRVELRNKKAVLMDTNQEIIDIQKEKKEINHNLKFIQQKYFIKANIARPQFKDEFDSLNDRIQEINLEEQILKARLKKKGTQRKFFVIMHKICTLGGIFNINKNNVNIVGSVDTSANSQKRKKIRHSKIKRKNRKKVNQNK
jgi:hypothetical protein